MLLFRFLIVMPTFSKRLIHRFFFGIHWKDFEARNSSWHTNELLLWFYFWAKFHIQRISLAKWAINLNEIAKKRIWHWMIYVGARAVQLHQADTLRSWRVYIGNVCRSTMVSRLMLLTVFFMFLVLRLYGVITVLFSLFSCQNCVPSLHQ